MDYHLYIFLMIQLMRQKKASVVVEGDLIQIKTILDDKRWRISAKVRTENNSLRKAFTTECFTHQNKAFFHTGGSFLHQKEDGLYLIKEVPALSRYVPFRSSMKDYLDELKLWSEVFDKECADV